MNATVYLLGILLQAVAAFIALAQVRIASRKLPWLFISLSSLLIVWRRLATLGQSLKPGRALAGPEIITLLVSLFFFLGVILMTRMFRDIWKDREEIQASRTRLSESNQLLSGVLGHTHMMAVLLDPEFNFIWVNRAYAETCRLPPDFFPGKNHFALYPDAENQAIFQRVVDSGEPFSITAKPFTFPDQPERGTTWWDWSLIPIRADGGRVTGLVFTLAEVSDRVRAQEALRESQEQFSSAFEFASIGVALVSPQGSFLRVNRALCEMLGYSGPELTRLTFQEITHPDDLTADLDQVHRMLEGAIDTYQMEKRYFGKRGNLIWVLLSVSLLRDPQGRPRFFISQIQDITARKQAVEALRESEERYARALRNAREGVYDWDLATDRVIYSRQWKAMLGYGDEEIEDRLSAWERLLHPDDRGRALDAVRDLLERGIPLNLEFRMRHKQGRWVEVLSRADLSRSPEGKPLRIVGTHVDVSEQKRQEEERRQREIQQQQADKMATLGILVSGVAHEINNPNNFIMLNADIVSRVWRDIEPILEAYDRRHHDLRLANLPFGELKERFLGIVNGIQDGALRIKEIVSDLREYALPDQSRMGDKVDVNTVLASSIRLTRNLIQKSTADFRQSLAPGLPPVRGSAQKLEQVFINIIQNACQALTDPRQTIEVGSSTDGAGQIAVQIRDQGRGLSAGELKHITDPFFTTHREEGGTGLGIPICKRILEAHGGTIAFDSEPGLGMTVTITLPPLGPEPAPTAPPPR